MAASATRPAFDVSHEDALWAAVWPGDFNGDGITDLASSAPAACHFCPPNAIQVSIGDGHGNFGAPIPTSTVGTVAGAADFNGDHRLDLIAFNDSGVVILPGNGNGTFGNARPVASGGTFVLSADMDGDGRRDLIFGHGTGLSVFPGHGDFTFGAPIAVDDHIELADAILVDVNGDGRRDIVAADRAIAGVVVVLNRGSLQFTSTFIPGPWATDVTAADMNGDGRVDIVVSVSAGLGESLNTGRGFAGILFGRGDGTFTAPTYYDTPNGAWQVVVGDFTRDGVPDIATANRSSIFSDDFCTGRKTWDSVTILPGRGDGTFGTPSSFSLGDQTDTALTADERFRNTVVTLNTSDLNGDGFTDLIASYGAILLGTAPRQNVAPRVDAGPDQIATTFEAQVPAMAFDADDDLLLWKWTDRLGNPIASWPALCDADLQQGRNVFTVTVDDQHGHTASDSVTITLDRGPIQDGGAEIAAAPPAQNWRHKDIGGVGAAGDAAFSSNKFILSGSGADIWNTADEFQYAYSLEEGGYGGVEMIARVDSLDPVNPWTKAGLMFRESLDPGSRQASVFITPGKGIAFQYRHQTDQISSTIAGPAWTAPIWLRLSIGDSIVNAYYKRNLGDPWTKLAQHDFDLPRFSRPWHYAGLAVTSHADGAVAKAVFSDLALRAFVLTTSVIGGGSGTGFLDRNRGTLTNRGTDIWNTSDQFTFMSVPRDGDQTLQAVFDDVANTYPWAKAGLMFRETAAANSPNVAIVVTPGRGISFQFRARTGAVTEMVTPAAGTAPILLRLRRSGDTFTGLWGRSADTLTTLGSVVIPMQDEVLAGVALTSHNTAATTSTHFTDLQFSR